MKTINDLFKAFTDNKKPLFTYGPNEVYADGKVYGISDKQANWLRDLIFKEFAGRDGLVCASQLNNTIDGYSYSLMAGKKNRIRVYKVIPLVN